MTNIELVNDYARLESWIAQRKGDFTLFALFLREEVPDRWDLIVSAPWVGSDTQGMVSYLVEEIKSFLGPQALIALARIVVVDANEPAVEKLNRLIPVQHGATEVRDSSFFGLPIKQAYIITSQRPGSPVAP